MKDKHKHFFGVHAFTLQKYVSCSISNTITLQSCTRNTRVVHHAECVIFFIRTCIYNNGWKSETFYPTRSIRQCCPLSSLLFIVVVEILAIQIRSAENITGIEVNLGEIKQLKITQLADDTTLFVKNETIKRFAYSGRIRSVLKSSNLIKLKLKLYS